MDIVELQRLIAELVHLAELISGSSDVDDAIVEIENDIEAILAEALDMVVFR